MAHTGHDISQVDYDKYENRLRTFSTWPSEAPVFIKDLVEAGLVYTGIRDVVFCFRCGVILKNWREDEEPLQKHELISNNCPYLEQRRERLEIPTRITTTSYSRSDSSGSTKSNDETSYYWDPYAGKVRRRDSLKTKAMAEIRLSPLTIPSKETRTSSPSNASGSPYRYHSFESRLGISCDRSFHEMRFERSRLSSFTGVYRKTFGPRPSELAKAGFYYLNMEDVVQCFCCDLTLSQWQEGDNPFELHAIEAPHCKFIQGLPSGNVPLQESEIAQHGTGNSRNFGANQLHLNSESDPTITSFHIPGPSGGHSLQIVRSHGGEMPDVQFLGSSGICLNGMPTGIPVNQLMLERQQSSQSGLSDDEIASISFPNSSPNLSRSSSLNQHSPQPKHIAPFTCQSEDMSDKMARLQTFFSWPHYVPVRPTDLAEAGFYYTKIADGVKCFKCDVQLRNWSPEDTAWGEHEKWSPQCPVVLEHKLSIKQKFETNEVQVTSRESSVGRYFNPHDTARSMHEFCRKLTPPLPGEQVNTLSVYHSSPQAPTTFQGTPCAIKELRLIDELVSTTKSNNITCEESSEKYVQNFTDYHYGPLLDMGFSVDIIKAVLEHYSSRYGKYHGAIDDLAEAILYYQENGSLSGFTWKHDGSSNESYPPSCITKFKPDSAIKNISSQGDNIHVIGTARVVSSSGETKLLPSSPPLSLNGNEDKSLQKELERVKEMQLCKICMDAQVGIVFLPCGHLIACPKCAIGITGETCPMCRATIQTAVRTYMS